MLSPRVLLAVVAIVLALGGLAAAAGSAHAAPTDPVNVPDAGFRAAINRAISSSRAADAVITEEDAARVVTFNSTSGTQIADFTGAEALTNMTSFTLRRTAGGTASSLQPFAGLTKLTTFALTGSAVTELAPLGGLTDLTSITLATSNLNSLHGLGGLTKLARLTLSGTRLTSLQGVEQLSALTVLSVTGSEISDLGPVSGLASLAEITINQARLTNLRGIEGLSNLKKVFASDNQLTGVPELAGLTGLTGVTLARNRISDLSPLAGLTNLESIGASFNRVTDIGFLRDLRLLFSVSLSNNLITDVSVFDEIGTYPTTGHRLRGLNNIIGLSGNRIRDLSALGLYPGSSSGHDQATKQLSQDLYVGPYQPGGITLDPKLYGMRSGGAGPATGTPAYISGGAGTYDSATGLLTLANPAAPSIQLSFGTLFDYFTVHFSEDPVKLADLRINEVESNGDAVNGDWFELYNPYDTALDVSGLVVSDSDDTHQLTLPAGSSVPARGYAAFRTDDPAVSGEFGLGETDSLRIFAPGTSDLAAATPIDAYSWTSHAATTYGRTAPGAGVWATTEVGTFAAVNVFPAATSIPTVVVSGDAANTDGRPPLTATVRRPGGSDVATDARGTVVFSVGGQAVSGPVSVSDGVARWTPSAPLSGSPTGIAHTVTASYVSAGAGDPYDDSAGESDPFTVTVTILEFGDVTVTVSTQTPHICQTVESTVSGWGAVEPDVVAYQWQKWDGTSLVWDNWAGYAGPTFTPVLSHFDPVTGILSGVSTGRWRLRVTGTKVGYAAKTVVGADLAVVRKTRFTATPAATLDNPAPRVGETVTGTHAAWSSCLPSNYDRTQYDYQWLRDGEPIADATDTITGDPKQVSYVVTGADAGHTLSLTVSVKGHLAFFAASATSEATARVAAGAFASAPVPAIDNGSPKVGETLTASAGAWSPEASFSYQWLRDGQPISGATGERYTAVVADFEKAISVEVTGRATGYVTESKASAATAKVAATVFAAAPDPSIDNGSPKVGDTLTATPGAWSPNAEFTYQWLREGRPVTGATGATYAVTAADLGYVISVQVTGRATGYTAATKTSAATGRVVARPAENPPIVNPPVINPPVVDPPVINPPVVDPPAGETSVRPSIRLVAVRGGKVRITVSARGVAKAIFGQKVTVKIAGVRGALSVTLKQGVTTFRLPGKVRGARRVKLSVALKRFTKSSGGTTYVVAAATKTVTVGIR